MTRRARLDRVGADAVEPARAAAEETGDGVGEHLEAVAEADRVVTHFFDCTLPGYRGWRWAVVVARAPRARSVTICETALLPGPDALTAPHWVPWSERLRAGDVGIGDLLPTDEFDERLQPAYVMSDDDAVEDIAFELGVGRRRVMTREGRLECAERWYEGDRGPNAEIAQSAPENARCGTCGFFLPLAGSMRQMFGVCGNVYAIDDAKAVSADHGCGAHSEVLADADGDDEGIDAAETVYDDSAVERVDVTDAGSEGESTEDADDSEDDAEDADDSEDDGDAGADDADDSEDDADSEADDTDDSDDDDESDSEESSSESSSSSDSSDGSDDEPEDADDSGDEDRGDSEATDSPAGTEEPTEAESSSDEDVIEVEVVGDVMVAVADAPGEGVAVSVEENTGDAEKA